MKLDSELLIQWRQENFPKVNLWFNNLILFYFANHVLFYINLITLKDEFFIVVFENLFILCII